MMVLRSSSKIESLEPSSSRAGRKTQKAGFLVLGVVFMFNDDDPLNIMYTCYEFERGITEIFLLIKFRVIVI